MWNGKCNNLKKSEISKLESTTDEQRTDELSTHSTSTEDISTIDFPSYCCNSDATNPALKRGRQLQLLQVSHFTLFRLLVSLL